MGRPGANARRRAREGKSPAKPGRTSWIHGSKIPFMEGYKDDFLKASELGKVYTGRFYDDVADAYLKKYGYNLEFTEDLPEGVDVADDVDEDEDVNALSPEEATARSAKYDELRTSDIGFAAVMEAPGCRAVKKLRRLISRRFSINNRWTPPAPTRARITDFYSRRCYAERIKPRFEARWAVVSKQDPTLAAVVVRNAVTKEAWEAESVPFKEEMRAALEAEHAAALAAYETVVKGDAPATPEEYQLALNNAGFYLQPFADAAAERFGMNVALLMCGPTPDRGGAIEVHSVHSGLSGGLVQRAWPDFDRAGFEATRRSFREFSEHCFSSEEKQARSLGGMPEMPHEESVPGASGRVNLDGLLPLEGDGNGDRGDDNNGAGGGEDDEDEEEDEEEEEDQAEPLRDVAEVMARNPDLAAEVERMEPGARESFRRRVKWSMPDYELDRESNMARNRRLFREAGIMGSVQSDTSRAAAAGDAAAAGENGGTGKKAPKPKKTPGDSVPVRRSARGHGEGDHEGDASGGAERPRPRAKYKGAEGAGIGVPLIPPQEDPTSIHPLEEVGAVLLLRPEDDPTSFGPLLNVSVDTHVGAIVLARPEEDPSSFGPLLPADVSTAVAPAPAIEGGGGGLVRPENEGMVVDPLEQQGAGAGAVEDGGGGGEDAEMVWGGMGDMDSWSLELRNAAAGLIRLKAFGGTQWVECVERLVGLERAWGFSDKGLLAAPTTGRPKVVKEWMRYARKWDAKVDLLTKEVGPRTVVGSFSATWWAWWSSVQPAGRERLAGALTRPELDGSEWEVLRKTSGRNGLLLFVEV
ncbi:hypothetical protein C8F04DRAFT_1256082 [Mycena alexandri]|uniref:Uncharacterized protein n=1 Tax=Mycena alexandri TaxID=1745969 RepID=A0AAD6T3E5_9AGAR|nr:hypothetical protein C8F04DRAFT_1256082 [Mycena alexandri]